MLRLSFSMGAPSQPSNVGFLKLLYNIRLMLEAIAPLAEDTY